MHQADDGLIARLRLPAGRLRPAQARSIAEVGAPGESLELTSRGNLQLRALDGAAAAKAVNTLAAAGLTPSPAHDRARTIVASPLIGRLAPQAPRAVGATEQAAGHGRLAGITDEFVSRLDEAIRALEETRAISGRVLTVIDDGTGHLLADEADLLIVWEPEAGDVRLVIGGLDAGRTAVGDAPRAAAALLGRLATACTAAGVWRARELPRAALITLARRPFDSAPVPTPAPDLPIGIVTQADGRSAVRAIAPLGRLTGAQLSTVADLAERAGTDLRIDDRRGLTLVDLPATSIASTTARTDARSIAGALAALGLITDAANPAVGLTACAGATCARTEVDVRAAARIRLAERRPGDGREHLVGCARRCGAPRTGTTIVAEPTDTPAQLAARATGAASASAALGRTSGSESAHSFGQVATAASPSASNGPEAAR